MTKKIVYANARVFLMQRLSMGGMVNLTLFALLTATINLSHVLFLLLKVMKTLS